MKHQIGKQVRIADGQAGARGHVFKKHHQHRVLEGLQFILERANVPTCS